MLLGLLRKTGLVRAIPVKEFKLTILILQPGPSAVLIRGAVIVQDQKVDVKEGLLGFDKRDLTVDKFPDKLQGDHADHLLLDAIPFYAYRFNSRKT